MLMIVSHISRPKDLPIYNLGSMDVKKFSFNEFHKVFNGLRHVYPFSVALGYPWFTMVNNFYAYNACAILFQWIPAIVIDAILFVLGRERV